MIVPDFNPPDIAPEDDEDVYLMIAFWRDAAGGHHCNIEGSVDGEDAAHCLAIAKALSSTAEYFAAGGRPLNATIH